MSIISLVVLVGGTFVGGKHHMIEDGGNVVVFPVDSPRDWVYEIRWQPSPKARWDCEAASVRRPRRRERPSRRTEGGERRIIEAEAGEGKTYHTAADGGSSGRVGQQRWFMAVGSKWSGGWRRTEGKALRIRRRQDGKRKVLARRTVSAEGERWWPKEESRSL